MNLYIVSMYATKQKADGFRIEHVPACWFAANIDEAKGKAYSYAHDTWNPANGWTDHSISVVQIPNWVIEEAFRSLK